MFLYPFHTQFLKTSLNRQQVVEKLTAETFLSDADYVKSDQQPRNFYGDISQQDFTLETIANNKPLVNFFTGEIRGSENEIYVLVQLGAWQHRRIFLLFVLLILACFTFVVNHLITFKSPYPQNLAAWLLLGTALALGTVFYTKAKQFNNNKHSSIKHLCERINAEAIPTESVPLIFR